MKDADNLIYNISSAGDVDYIPAGFGVFSTFPTDRNITKSNLEHLLSGQPLVDLTDEEYVHWLQLDREALEYVKQHFH